MQLGTHVKDTNPDLQSEGHLQVFEDDWYIRVKASVKGEVILLAQDIELIQSNISGFAAGISCN